MSPPFKPLPARGWKRNALLFLLGLCAAAAMPPIFLFALLIPSFAGLWMFIEQAATPRRAFWDGWWWGLGFFIAGLYWTCISLLVDAERFAWLIPVNLLGLNGLFAIYTGLAARLAWYLRGRGLRSVLGFTAIWVLIEALRGWLFTGFPWNLIGYAANTSLNAMQLASVTGVYGLSFLVVFSVTMLAALKPPHGWRWATGMFLVWCTLLLWGGLRVSGASLETVAGVKLRLVQPAIAQSLKYDPLETGRVMRTLMEMSTWKQEGITAVIWPEAAWPMPYRGLGEDLAIPAQAAPDDGVLLFGLDRMEGQGPSLKAWNSFAAITAHREVLAEYDKVHLVPFGEYVPLRSVLPLDKIAPGAVDFSTGDKHDALTVSGLPSFKPLICYEAIFPALAQSDGKADWLLNITNDAWFGNSTGPYQHLEMSRMRAVEQGIPLVRVANTGISAVVDGVGRVRERLGLGKKGVLDVELPKRLPAATIYAKYGDWPMLVFLVICLGFACINREKTKQ